MGASRKNHQAGQQMLFWLSEAAVEARGHYKPDAVAVIAEVDARTIRRFENGEHWPQRLDEILSAYAFLGDIEDARALWQRALDQWYAHGTMPTFDQHESTSSQRRIADRIKAQTDRTKPAKDRGTPARESSATRKRRATK